MFLPNILIKNEELDLLYNFLSYEYNQSIKKQKTFIPILRISGLHYR